METDFTEKEIKNLIKDLEVQRNMAKNKIHDYTQLLSDMRCKIFSIDKTIEQMENKYKEITGKKYLEVRF